jgi:hypothetical protein
MLAVTANWLFTDGSLAPACAAGADAWLHTIRRAVIRAGYRRNGRYEPVGNVSLVFAGDTFDWLVSDVWSGRERPWHGGPRSRETRLKVVARSLRAARPILAELHRWARRGIPVPAVDGRGRPSARSVLHIPLRVVMLAGDRDSWASEEFGGHDDPHRRFGLWVGNSWSDDEITIRHGHDRDPVTHAGAAPIAAAAGRAPSLAESLAVDLVVPFAKALAADTAGWHLARRHVGAIASSELVDMPKAVAELVGVWGAATAPGRRVLLAWRRCVTAWRTIARHEPPASETEYDVADSVADWFEESVERHDQPLPRTIARLSLSRADAEEPGTILGHMPIESRRSSRFPWLMVVKPTRSLELLGPVTPEPPVVTIGVTGGERIVEAA